MIEVSALRVAGFGTIVRCGNCWHGPFDIGDSRRARNYSASSSGTVNLSRSACGPGHVSFVSPKCAWVIPHTMHFDPSKGQRWPPAR